MIKEKLKRLALAIPAAFVAMWMIGYSPEAAFNWLNALDAQFHLNGDEQDDINCTWTTSNPATLTCPKAFTSFDVGKAVSIDYAGSSFHAFKSTIASVSGGIATLGAPPTSASPLFHVTNLGHTQSGGVGYQIGDSVGLPCPAGCSALNQATGIVSEIGFFSDGTHLPTVASAGSGGSAGATCTVTGTTGYALKGNLIQVNVTLNGSGNLGAGSTINSYGNVTGPNPSTYTQNMTTPSSEPVSAGTCLGLTGAALNFAPSGTPVFQAINVKDNDLSTGFYHTFSASNCNNSNVTLTTLSGSGNGATINCNTVVVDARWGTNNTAAFQQLFTADNALSALLAPVNIYIPAGKYLTNPPNVPLVHFGSVMGDGQFNTVIFLLPNQAGDWLAIKDGGRGCMQLQGGTCTFSSSTNGAQGSSRIGGMTVVGDRSSSTPQNAFMFYGGNVWLHITDIQAYYVLGRCLGVGADDTLANGGKGNIQESDITDVRCEDDGDVNVPTVDIISMGAIAGPNSVKMRNFRIFDPHGPGIRIASCSDNDPAHVITLTDSHGELSGMIGTSQLGDALVMGDTNCTNEVFPIFDWGTSGHFFTPTNSTNPGVAGIQGSGNTFNNTPGGWSSTAGKYANIHVLGNSANSGLNLSANIAAAGGSTGLGWAIDGCQNCKFSSEANGANDYQFRAGTSLGSTTMGPGVTYDCGSVGCLSANNLFAETDAQPGGANALSFPVYTNNYGHPLGIFYNQTVGAANATTGVQSMIGSGLGGTDIGSGYISFGTEFDEYASGTFSTAAGGGALSFIFNLGGQPIATWTSLGMGSSKSGLGWWANVRCVFTSVTPANSATAQCTGVLDYQSGAFTAVNPVFVSAVITGIDTTTLTGTQTSLQTQWTTFNSGNTIIATNLTEWLPN